MLRLERVSKRFGGVVATDAVSLEVTEGEVHALIGPNGAGKTTLIGQISGTLAPDAGEVFFEERTITRVPQHKRVAAGLARSYQITSIFRRFSVLDNLALAVQARSGSSFSFWRPVSAEKSLFDEARAIAAEVNLAEKADSIAATLAHGEQRALEVGLALATQPKLVLLDEPMAGMGPEESQRMIELILRIRRARHRPAGRARHGRGVPPRRAHLGAGGRARHRHRHAGRGSRRTPKCAAPTWETSLLLEIENLETAYGASQVLFNLSLQIKEGEAVTLLGRNGMGKTTTVRSIMGLTRARAGAISFRGRRIEREAPDSIARMGIALVPEGRQIFPNLTVKENLVAFAGNRSARSEPWSPDKVFEFFPALKAREDNMGNQLSGGEQQMLAIGRALVTNPHLLILDEATEGLAPLIREEIWKCLERLRAAGQTILVIDKYIERLVKLADRHTIIERGKVAWQGSSAELDADRGLWHRYLGV